MVDAISLEKHTASKFDKRKSLVIFGTGDTAVMAADYFEYESHYSVVGFTVDREYIKKEKFLGVGVIPFDEVTNRFPPGYCDMFIAVGYKDLNRLRSTKFYEAKRKGYFLASFISPNTYIGRNVKMGENVMIQEKNNIQHGCLVGDDVILWAGNHIGHGTQLRDHVYIASHVVVSGSCYIGDYSFLGVNVSLSERVTVGPLTLVGAGVHLYKSVPGGMAYVVKKNFEERRFDELSERAQAMFMAR
jgi:sugar O-acyltransferase (sialic acid O-acetyltransferase NeuD family)